MRQRETGRGWRDNCNRPVNSIMLGLMPAPTAVFMSDVHLGIESRERETAREARLLDFLRSLPGRTSHLYVVGDLFEFWFEYATAIPRRYFGLLRALDEIRERGVVITCMAGNHDFWLGHFLSDELGIRTVDGALAVEHQGRRIWLHHGDGLMGGDLGYKVLRRVLRSPASIALYRWVHPDLGIPFAHWASHWSRNSRGRRRLDGERMFRQLAVPRFAEGFDAVMVGHFHQVYEQRENRHAFFVLGDWFENFSYVELDQGEFHQRCWPERALAAVAR
jgi:UDP-2,3-diacylglucosamine hydrolase